MNKELIVGGGCFWCLEAVFQRLKGVTSVQSGYSGGHIKNPAYREVCNGTTGHAEVIKIVYNDELISITSLLEVFFKLHDPTTLNRQGNDVGTQYRSIILYNNEDEKVLLQNFITDSASTFYANPIITELKEFEAFYAAESNHDNYFNSHKNQPYCKIVIDPKVKKLMANFQNLVNEV